VTQGCGDRLEGAAWSIYPIGRDIDRAAKNCRGADDPEPNIGGCVTGILASMAYVATSGLSLASASGVDCKDVTADDIELAIEVLDGSKGINDIHFRRKSKDLACARDIISSSRQLGLAAAMAGQAAVLCGAKSRCGQYVGFTAAALSATAEAVTLIVDDCRLRPNATASDRRTRRIQCTRFMASAMKELSVTAALALDASEECRNSSVAAGICGSSITKALAAFAYLTERTVLMARDCPEPKRRFSCARNFQQDAISSRTARPLRSQAWP